MSDLPAIDPAGHLIHLGPQKTGTTAIQVALFGVRDQLPEYGAYYPGGSYRRRRAGWALGLPGAPRGMKRDLRYWRSLVQEVQAAEGLRVCISDENYARANRETAQKIVTDLAGPTTQIVAVAKRFDKLLPSQWQERVKSGQQRDFEQWLRVILDGEPAEFDYEYWNFWQGHDFAKLVERWTEFVPAEKFTLIIADDSDRNQLYRVFEQLLALPTGLLRSDASKSNESVRWSELEFLRGLRQMYLDSGGPIEELSRLRNAVVNSLRASTTAPLGPKSPPFPDWAVERLQELGAQRAEQAANLPVRVVGDAASLARVELEPDPGITADQLVIPVDRVVSIAQGILKAQGAFEPLPQAAEAAPASAAPAPEPSTPLADASTRQLAGALLRRITGRS